MMYLAFKHTTNTGKWYAKLLDKVIAMRTNGPAVHVELVFSDGTSFSSSQWDGGVRFKDIQYEGDTKWALVPLHIPPEKEATVRGVAEILASTKIKYDWKGILGFMLGKSDPGVPDKFFCSEICVWVLQHIGLFKYIKPAETDPWLLECIARERASFYVAP